MIAQITHITKESFEHEIENSQKPVLVDFWADWCGPCHVVAPILEEVAKDHEGKVRVAKINTDEQQQLAAQFNITSIPTMILFVKGKEVGRTLGVHPKDNIEAFVKEHVVFRGVKNV